MPWFMDRGFEVVSEGFVPAGAMPLEDFVAKFTGVRYVVDPGSKRERNYAFANIGDLWIGSFYGFPLVNPLTLAALKRCGSVPTRSRRTGASAPCTATGDTIGPPEEDCVPAGETQLPTMAFEVVPGHL